MDQSNIIHNGFKRPDTLEGYTLRLATGHCGSFFLTLNEHDDKLCEVRMSIGKAGSCTKMLFETVAILISILLQSGMSKEKIKDKLINRLDSYCGHKILVEGEEYHSCIDYSIKKILEDMLSRGEMNND